MCGDCSVLLCVVCFISGLVIRCVVTLTLPPPSLQNETTNVVMNIIVASS